MPDPPKIPCLTRYLLPLLVVLAVAVFVFSLVTTPVQRVPAPETPALDGTAWVLVSLDDGNGTLRPAIPGSNVTASFRNDSLSTSLNLPP